MFNVDNGKAIVIADFVQLNINRNFSYFVKANFRSNCSQVFCEISVLGFFINLQEIACARVSFQ